MSYYKCRTCGWSGDWSESHSMERCPRCSKDSLVVEMPNVIFLVIRQKKDGRLFLHPEVFKSQREALDNKQRIKDLDDDCECVWVFMVDLHYHEELKDA